MKIIKNFGLLALIFLFLISAASILYTEIKQPIGVIITSVGDKNPCKDIVVVGSTITEIGNKVIKNSNDFYESLGGLEGVITFTINNNPRSCNIPKGSKLDINATNVKKIGMKLGTDLWGGINYFFEVNNKSQDLINVLEQRSVKYGLSNTKIDLYNNTFIRITTGPDEEGYITLLTEQGKLEGKIEEPLSLTEKPVEFVFNDKSYEVSLKGKNVKVNESVYEIGDHFNLDGVDISIENFVGNETIISVKIFDDKDLTVIQNSKLGYSRIVKQGNGYIFIVPVSLSEKVSENFAKATKNLEVSVNPTTGESYSKYPINIFIDEKQFASIPLLSDEIGKKRDNFILWGYTQSTEDATKSMIRLRTIIELKSLPQKLTLYKNEVFKSNSGSVLTSTLLTVSLISSVVTALFFFVKYRKNGVASIPLILIVLGELVLLFGIVSTDWLMLVIFCAGFVVVLLRGDISNWKNWIGVLTFSVLLIGIFMSKSNGGWVLDSSFFVGSIAVIIIGFAFNTFMGIKVLTKKESYTQSDYRVATNKLWLLSTVLAFILIISYFIFSSIYSSHIGFIMAVSTGLWVNLSLTIPVYSDTIKKIIK